MTHHAGMKTLPVIATMLLLAGSGTAAAKTYPFADADDYLAPASAMESWAATVARHRAQQNQLYLCADDRTACRGRLRSYNKAIVRARELTPDEQIELVHFYINRTQYDDDRVKRLYDDAGHRVGIARNHWSSLHDFLIEGGDCEDFATAKYFMLRELGFEPQDMRVVVVWERKLRGYHAILAVRHANDEVWLLDSDNFIRRNGHRGYRYVYAMNEQAVWDHREDFSGATLHTTE